MLRFLERNTLTLAMLAMQNYFDSAAPLFGMPHHFAAGISHSDDMQDRAAVRNTRSSESVG